MNMPISIQMYTLREYTKNDFVGTLERVAEIGYKGVEFAGFGGLTAGQLKGHLDRLGLAATGSHTSLDLLKSDLDQVIEYNLEIGNPYIICPWNEYKNGKEDFEETVKLFKAIGEKCREKGLQFGYHNHEHEFVKLGDEYGLDFLYNNVDPQLLFAELDTFWVKYAGEDPIEYIKKYSGRCPLVHLKDMEDGEERFFAEVGNGIMDMKGIISAAKAAGTKWLIVEQDRCRRPAIESAKISFDNLKKMVAAW